MKLFQRSLNTLQQRNQFFFYWIWIKSVKKYLYSGKQTKKHSHIFLLFLKCMNISTQQCSYWLHSFSKRLTFTITLCERETKLLDHLYANEVIFLVVQLLKWFIDSTAQWMPRTCLLFGQNLSSICRESTKKEFVFRWTNWLSRSNFKWINKHFE